eukprot:8209331-Lingulodinium_polyedra.AAC.1
MVACSVPVQHGATQSLCTLLPRRSGVPRVPRARCSGTTQGGGKGQGLPLPDPSFTAISLQHWVPRKGESHLR